ncbi:hypothetical protein yc1106_02933 [Curvularia clavata]|uniref:Uncharacterized protein n=1 Tax=Curvularia clavata TaxID=95742 RepID=A0A9Q8Z459_CURCL|nr:hypothetical protein yc1106_02933 [Curvularia clavata]
MSGPNNNEDARPKTTPHFDPMAELLDLGRMRFDTETAAPSNRDTALAYPGAHTALLPRAGHAPRGLEAQVHAWTTFQYTTDEVDVKEELKGDLHGGQLHRVNRAARGEEPIIREKGGKGKAKGGDENELCAGRKPERGGLPMAKGMAEEMEKGMFWDEKII